MIRKLWVFLAFLWLQAGADEARLTIDTGAHTGTIWDVVVMKNGDVITASGDKTIRVWDKKSFHEKRKILGDIGDATVGQIFAIALSPDEKYLAVGGYLHAKKSATYGLIRIYDFQSGTLVKTLDAHNNVINDLAFSPDGKYLLSGSTDASVKFWDMGTFTLLSSFEFHKGSVFEVALEQEQNKLVAYSTSYDHSIAKFDPFSKEILATFVADDKLQRLALKNNEIAVCGFEKNIYILDKNLKLKKKFATHVVMKKLAYTPDGAHLLAGSADAPYGVTVYDTAYREKGRFSEHTNTVVAIAPLNSNQIVSCGGIKKDIYLWDLATLKAQKHKTGNGEVVWSVGIANNLVAWGNVFDVTGNFRIKQSSLRKSFHLATDTVHPLTNESGIKRINNEGLSHGRGGDFNDEDGVLYIQTTGAKIVKTSVDGYGVKCYGWYKEYVVAGSAHGNLHIYDKYGNTVAQLVGHTGTVWSLALDGDRLVSGADDQTMMVWDLRGLESKELVSSSFFNKDWQDFVEKHYPQIDLSKQNDIAKLHQFLLRDYGEKEANKLFVTVKKISPVVSIFVATDNEWVIWNPDGYYTASPKGDRYVGWHLNRGEEKEAFFYPVGKFKARYYNPELLDFLLQGFSKEEVFVKLNKQEPIASIADSLPPYLTFAQYPEIDTQDAAVQLRVRVVSRSDIIGYKYLFNGRPLEDIRGLKPKKEGDAVVLSTSLPPMSGKLQVIAQNRFGFSDPVEFQVNYLGSAKDFYKPNLYLLSIGVAQYDDAEIRLGFSAKDAEDFSAVWKKQEGKLYKEVTTKTLTDKEATKDNILDALEWLQKQTTAKDVAVVFLAGHGVNDENGNFYFLPVDYNDARLKRTGVPFSEFTMTLSSIAGKVLLFADTCHSGNIMGKRRAVDTNGLVSELNDAQNGVVVFTSSTGKQYSLEHKDWNNGAFTKALIEGLGGKADLLGHGKITVDSLSFYVSERVKELTKGKQTPTGSKPNTIPDFPISVR